MSGERSGSPGNILVFFPVLGKFKPLNVIATATDGAVTIPACPARLAPILFQSCLGPDYETFDRIFLDTDCVADGNVAAVTNCWPEGTSAALTLSREFMQSLKEHESIILTKKIEVASSESKHEHFLVGFDSAESDWLCDFINNWLVLVLKKKTKRKMDKEQHKTEATKKACTNARISKEVICID